MFLDNTAENDNEEQTYFDQKSSLEPFGSGELKERRRINVLPVHPMSQEHGAIKKVEILVAVARE